jgi:bile acid:Na+ symporter, BASS family
LLIQFGRHGTVWLAAGVFLGFVLPFLAASLRPWLGLIVTATLALALARIDWSEVRRYARRPILATILVVWLLLICPVLVWGICRIVGLPAGLAAAVILMAASIPIGSAPAFALLLGLDAALAVLLVLVPALFVSLTLPPIAVTLGGTAIAASAFDIGYRLAIMIGSAFLLAGAARRLLPRGWIASHTIEIDGFSVILLVLFAIAVMDGVMALALTDPGLVAFYLAVGYAANIGLQILGAAAFMRLGWRAGLTVGLCNGNRNMGIILVVLAGEASFEVTAYFAIAQVPMYTLPMILNPLYAALLRKRT